MAANPQYSNQDGKDNDGYEIVHVIKNDEIPPHRDVFLDFFHGHDAGYSALTVNVFNPGVWLEMREMNPHTRSIVIKNGDAASRDYAYTIYFSRNKDDADRYAVKTVLAGAKPDQVIREVLDAANYGYDQYVKVEIKPTTGQAVDQLNFQVYLTGRGG